MGDALEVFSEVSVSLLLNGAFQQPQDDWKQHFHKAQHGLRHPLCSQRLLDGQKKKIRTEEDDRLKQMQERKLTALKFIAADIRAVKILKI